MICAMTCGCGNKIQTFDSSQPEGCNNSKVRLRCSIYKHICIYTHIHVCTSLSSYIYTYIIQYMYICTSEVVGLRPTGKSCRFVRACAAVCKVKMDLINDAHSFSLFPFRQKISSLFPCEIRCSLSLEIDEIKGIQVSPSESK